MLKLGIIGYPLEHSLSPVMHSAALQYLNVSGSYRAIETEEKELERVFKQLKDSRFKGFNVTIPHKITIIPFLDELSETAKLAGAVNTVVFRNGGKSAGENTDVAGFWEAIPKDAREDISKETVSLLGTGRSARAIGVALLKNNAKIIKIFGRSKEKLSAFLDFMESRRELTGSKTKIEGGLISGLDLTNTFMLINSTPLGMYPNIDASPVTKEELKKMMPNGIVYDIIYNPPQTLLLLQARSLGFKTINGTEMLIRQGAQSLSIWLEQNVAPVGVMRLAVNHSLEEVKASKNL